MSRLDTYGDSVLFKSIILKNDKDLIRQLGTLIFSVNIEEMGIRWKVTGPSDGHSLVTFWKNRARGHASCGDSGNGSV